MEITAELVLLLIFSTSIIGLLFCEYEEMLHPDIVSLAARIKIDGGRLGILAKLRLSRFNKMAITHNFYSDIVCMYSPDACLFDKNTGKVSTMYNISGGSSDLVQP